MYGNFSLDEIVFNPTSYKSNPQYMGGEVKRSLNGTGHRAIRGVKHQPEMEVDLPQQLYVAFKNKYVQQTTHVLKDDEGNQFIVWFDGFDLERVDAQDVWYTGSIKFVEV